jgi:hypothetical protein
MMSFKYCRRIKLYNGGVVIWVLMFRNIIRVGFFCSVILFTLTGADIIGL